MNYLKQFAGILLLVIFAMAFAACPAPDEDPPPKIPPKLYSIALDSEGNGSVTSDLTVAEEGATVSLNVQAGERWRIGTVKFVSGTSEKNCTDAGDGMYTFVMPAGNVTVKTVFVEFDKFMVEVPRIANGVLTADPRQAYAGETVTLTAVPDNNYKYRDNSLKVFEKVENEGDTPEAIEIIPVEGTSDKWTITMPEYDVTVSAMFMPKNRELSELHIPDEIVGGGSITIESGLYEAFDGETVTVILSAPADTRYKPGTFNVDAVAEESAALIPQSPVVYDEDNHRWKATFTMPKEPVNIVAEFEKIPLHTVTITQSTGGTISVTPLVAEEAYEGTKITVTVTIEDPDNYRYVADSLRIKGASNAVVGANKPGEELLWTFIMPAEAVTVSAGIEFIPYYAITESTAFGTMVISGTVTEEGEYKGKARGGTPITLTLSANAGYKLPADGPVISPALTLGGGGSVWTFTMPENDVAITMNFPALGALEIYKSGLNPKVTISDNIKGCMYFANSINFIDPVYELDGKRVMKITRVPDAEAADTNGDGNPDIQAQYGFDLNSSLALNLKENNVTALSFRVKASKPKAQANANTFEFAGFGDQAVPAQVKLALISTTKNLSAIVDTEWKQFIVPVPPMKEETAVKRVFFIKFDLDADHSVYLDDIEFLTGSDAVFEGVEIPSANSGLLLNNDAFNPATVLQGKIGLAYTAGTVNGALYDRTAAADLVTNFANWFDISYEVDGQASINAVTGMVAPEGLGSEFNLYAVVGGTKSNAMQFTVSSKLMKIIDNFSARNNGGWYSDFTTVQYGYWYSGMLTGGDCWIAGAGQGDYDNVQPQNAKIAYFTPDPAAVAGSGAGRNLPSAMNLSGVSEISIVFRVTSATDTYEFALYNDSTLAGTETGTPFKVPLTGDYAPGAVDTWKEIIIPVSAFAGIDMSKVSGWGIFVTNRGAGNGRFYIDSIKAAESE